MGHRNFSKVFIFMMRSGNAEFFSFERFIRRHKHLPDFRSELSKLMNIYTKAYAQGRTRSEASPKEMLARFGLGPGGLIARWVSKLERKT